MSVASKKRRRRIFLVGIVLVLGLLLAGGFKARRVYRNRRDARLRMQAVADVQAGRYEEALVKLEPYLQRHPDDTTALAAYVQARPRVELPRGEHIRLTMARLRELLDREPQRIPARRVLMDLYLQNNLRTETIDSADKLLALVPNDPEALRAKTYANIQLGRYPEAMQWCQNWSKAAPLDLEAHVTCLFLKRQLGQSDESIIAYAQSQRATHPGNARFDLLMAYAHGMARDPQTALPFLRCAALQAMLDPVLAAVPCLARPGHAAVVDGYFVSLLSDQLRDLRRYHESLAILLRTGPASAGANLRIERTIVTRLWEAERYQDVVNRMAGVAPDTQVDSELLGIQAVALLEVGRRDDAIAIRERLLARDYDSYAAAWAAILQTYLFPDAPDYRRLVDAARPLIDGRAASPYVRFYAADAFAQLGETELAFANWRAAQQGSTWARPALRLAGASISSGEATGALWMAMLACLSTRDSRPAVLSLASATAAVVDLLGQPGPGADEAIRLLAEIKKNWPDDDQTLPIRLVRPLDLGDSPSARQALKPALEQGLLALLDEIERRWPDEESILPLAARLHVDRGEPGPARAIMRRALDGPKCPSMAVMLRLAEMSTHAHLDLEDALLARCEKEHGLTADLAYSQALTLWRGGDPEAGLKKLEKAKSGKQGADAIPYRAAWARYLSLRRDKSAVQGWVALADDFPDNLQVQRLAIDSISGAQDRDAQLRVIERLHTLTGEQALAWRFLKARWLLAGPLTDKNLSEAATLLINVVQRIPTHASAQLLLAACLERQKDIAGAIAHLEAVQRAQPGSLDVSLELARLLLSQNNVSRAREQLQGVSQRYLDESARRRDAVVAIGRRAARSPFDMGRFEPAAADLHPLALAEFASARSVKNLAVMLVDQGESDLALSLLERAVDMGPDERASLVLAKLYRQRKMPYKAEEIYRKLLARPSATVVSEAVQFYIAQQRPDEVKRLLDLLPGLKPPPGVEHTILASVEADPVAAVKHLNGAIEEDPKNSAYWRQLILWYIRQGQAAEALDAAARARGAVPSDPAFGSFLDQAERIRVLTEPPERPLVSELLDDSADQTATVEALTILADARRDRLPANQYIPPLRRLADRYPHFVPLHTFLAVLYANVGRPDEGVAIASRAMEAVPSAVEPAHVAALILAQEGRWSEVVAVATAWRNRVVGESVAANMLLARALVHTNRAAEAVRQLDPYKDRALAQSDKLSEILSLYVGAMLAAGQENQAATFLASSLPGNRGVRALTMTAVAEYAVTPDSATRWLNRLASMIPTGSPLLASPEQVTLAEAWLTCGIRFNDAQARQNCLKILGELAARTDLMPDIALKVATLYERSGNRPAAEPIYRQVIANSAVPYLVGAASNNLAMLLAARATGDDLDEALKMAQQAADTLQDKKPVATFYDTLAYVRQQRHEYTQALAAAQKAIDLAPQDLGQRLRLASIHIDAAQYAQAKTVLADIEQRMANSGQQVPKAQQEELDRLKQRLPTSRPATRP